MSLASAGESVYEGLTTGSHAEVCMVIKRQANFHVCNGTSGCCVMQVGPIVPALLPPLVTKLADSDSSPLVVHLLLVLAQLALINTNQLVDCLAAQPGPGAPAACSHAAAG